MDKTYKITLSDGKVIENLKMNGNNFISKDEILEDIFIGNLSSVSIEDSEGVTENHTNMELVQVKQYGNEYWFILRDLTEDELTKITQRADLEYVAMMTGVEL